MLCGLAVGEAAAAALCGRGLFCAERFDDRAGGCRDAVVSAAGACSAACPHAATMRQVAMAAKACVLAFGMSHSPGTAMRSNLVTGKAQGSLSNPNV